MISSLFVILVALCNAVMDVTSFYWATSIFSKYPKLFPPRYWNPSISWTNKWKNGIEAEGPRFWGSSRIFVWVTDAWHFFKSLMICFFIAAIVLFEPLPEINKYWDFVIDGILYCAFFDLFFNKTLRIKPIIKT